MTVEQRAARVRMLLFDVDGVLTDGIVIIHSDGSESKGFSIRDGAALVWAQRAGLTVGLISARASQATAHRAAQLAIRIVVQGVSSKVDAYTKIVGDAGIGDEAVAYMGDDLVDLPLFGRAGLAAAPGDAAAEVREHAHWVAKAGGGRGAVREFVEMILRAQDKWESLVRTYSTS